MFLRSDIRGQATVEAAFLLPALMLLLLLLLQPGILLYDRMVMQGAAADACRLLATSAGDRAYCEDYVRRRLGAVPQQENFHVHESGCTWNIAFSGDETSAQVGVEISTEVKPLPLIDVGGALLGLLNESGNFEVRVSASAPTQPAWVEGAIAGGNPAAWVGAWLNEA